MLFARTAWDVPKHERRSQPLYHRGQIRPVVGQPFPDTGLFRWDITSESAVTREEPVVPQLPRWAIGKPSSLLPLALCLAAECDHIAAELRSCDAVGLRGIHRSFLATRSARQSILVKT